MLVYGLATANTAIFVAVLAPLLTTGVVHPIRSLTRAARAVTAGRLDTRVKVTTADELGELARSFNQMLDELQASRARIVAAADASRRKVERDLHDGAQQRLVLLALKASMLEGEHGSTPLISEIRAEIQLAMTELRDLAHGLYPQVLESDGLPGALAEVAGNAAIPTTFDCNGAERYRSELEAAVYFCCLEALQNAAKHAGDGARASVKLAQCDQRLEFEISDDGHGFDPSATDGSSGLQNMRDRIGALGGELRIESVRGSGTTITGIVPTGAKR
jgi:signal transduction histidine kinase